MADVTRDGAWHARLTIQQQGGLKMDARTAHGGADSELLAWLDRSGVRYVVHEHGEALSAYGAAIADAVDPHTFAKVVGVETDAGERVLVVVEATDQVDLHKAKVILGARKVRLMTEEEIAAVAPTSEVGALPAVGQLYGLPMLADEAIRGVGSVTFNAGSHHVSVRMERAAWERATGVTYADLARDEDTLPAWAR
jgi:Ala-tRNA(Pro) deacylase